MNQILSPAPTSARETAQACRLTIVLDDQAVHIPAWVQDHASFRRWLHSDDFPERTGRICYLDGEVWIDISKEQLFTHNQLKAEISRVLGNLVKAERLGRFFIDGALISNVEASLTSQPDGTFVSRKSLEIGRVLLVEGKKKGYVEMEGTPDMVLEVVSDSSVTKDTARLRELYGRAGVREYWLLDARGEELEFAVLRRTARGYVAVRKEAGWLKSSAFGKSFRLVQEVDELGNPEYTLEAR